MHHRLGDSSDAEDTWCPEVSRGQGTISKPTVDIRLLGPEDRAVLDNVAPDAFDHPIAPRWAAEFFDDPRHHLAVALDDGVVVGFASGVHYVHPDKPPELWINEVGVAPSHQRQGVASRLLAALLDHGARLGCVQAWVLTSPANSAARQLYAHAGGREAEELSVMFEFPLAPGGHKEGTNG